MAGCAGPRRVRAMLDGMQQRLGPSMGIVTTRAVGLCNLEAAVLRLQSLRVMTLPAEVRRRLSEQFPVIRAVRIMACTAFSLSNRFMKGFPRKNLLELRMASYAEIFLRFIKKALVLGRMRRVTGFA